MDVISNNVVNNVQKEPVYKNTYDKIVNIKKFLNNDTNQGIAAIGANVNISKTTADDKLIEVFANFNLQITDCSNRITLDFSCADQEHYNNSIYKVDTLIDTLKQFKRGIEKGRNAVIELEKTVKKFKKPSRGR